MTAKLVGLNAFASIEHRLVARRTTIGSAAANDLIVAHKSVSGKHAQISCRSGRHFIKDLASTNGTFINGRRIEGTQPLNPGDEIRFGAARFAMVGGKRHARPLQRYATIAAALLAIAALGYLAFDFIGNWENLEQLAATKSSTAPSAAATANSISTPASVTAGSIAPWLAAINELRASVKLPPVIEDPKLSAGDLNHAKYLVKNYADRVGPGHLVGAEMHDEDKGNSWYSPEGATAGAHSDVNQSWGNESPPSARWAVNNWIAGPFHRLWILNPRLHRVGYGEFCEKKYCVAALNLGDGSDPPDGPEPLATPIEYPNHNSPTSIISFAGEWPNPLTSCPNIEGQAGMPATIQLGSMVDAKLADYSITRDGHGVESCAIDATNYQNPIAAEQTRGRAILHELGAAVIIPKLPLKPGGHYTVTATLNNHAYQWTFDVMGPQFFGPSSEASPIEAVPIIVATPLPTASPSPSPSPTNEAPSARPTPSRASRRARRKTPIVRRESPSEIPLAKTTASFPKAGTTETPAEAKDASGAPLWLREINRYRVELGLAPVVDDPLLTAGDRDHATYLTKNFIEALPPRNIDASAHTEVPGNQWYTPAGYEAASHSDVADFAFPMPRLPLPSPLWALDSWMEGVFHRLPLLSPILHRVGYGEFCEERGCAAAIDVTGAWQSFSYPVPFAQPIEFPPPNSSVAMRSLQGEWPDPTTACPGFRMPVGLPISLELGYEVAAKLSTYSISNRGKPIDACGYDSGTYTNARTSDQDRARTILRNYGATVILPREALEVGVYEVSATVNDHRYDWSFTVTR